jgi:hypothetical protein
MGRFGQAIAVSLAALAGAVALSGCGSASGSSVPVSRPTTLCAPQPNGALCIKVFQHGGTIQDVIAYLSASDSPLAGKTWRLVLSRFACDPGSAAQPACAASATYPGPTRHGLPPQQTYCRTQSGQTVTTGAGCHDTLAQQMASIGDWSGLVVPKRFASRTWLCVSEEIGTGGSWRQPDRALATTPVRACAEVSPA